MLLSMTSYGRASADFENKRIIIELKSLNSKFIDLRLKIPSNFHDKEMWVRKHIHDHFLRGKVEATFTYENQEGGEIYTINKSIFKEYYRQLSTLSSELNLSNESILPAILKLPEVVSSSEEKMADNEWEIIKNTLDEALDKVKIHRKEEGASIENDMIKRIEAILSYLESIGPLEKARVEKVRQKMSASLAEYLQRQHVDENRFEQEVLFYLEKIDITEEKVRLKQHCEYFLQELAVDRSLKGKKLTFISQEIGREINTLGAKAYSSSIQKFVVLMKDELEKIKEQLANVI